MATISSGKTTADSNLKSLATQLAKANLARSILRLYIDIQRLMLAENGLHDVRIYTSVHEAHPNIY
jgi:phosphatidate phosphatase APP1